ncbi:MAG: CBS domain-containing protein [Pseudomonadota bacterium]|nr:CBS domain-containing protein [Pseudomonadota bacterium]
MNVAQILKHKGREVLTIAPHHDLGLAAEMLHKRRVGAVVVADAAGAVLGILSERDIVRAVGLRGADALPEPVSKHMTANPTTVGEDTAVDELMHMMTEGRFRHLPVVEGGRLVGIVSIGDVVKNHVDVLNHERDSLREYIATA